MASIEYADLKYEKSAEVTVDGKITYHEKETQY